MLQIVARIKIPHLSFHCSHNSVVFMSLVINTTIQPLLIKSSLAFPTPVEETSWT